ncbi:MAG: histidine phosphatase family protein, partial [Gammaproteobacteria bacterium]
MSAPRYLVRHPRPQVEPGVCYGATDLAVAPDVLAACAARLRAALPPHLPVYASPLRRCAELARALTGDALIIDARLTELDFGRWEMRRWDAIERAEIDA